MDDCQVWVDVANQLELHPNKTQFMKSQAAFFNLSVATLYRRLEKYTNWNSGKKTRSDKGSTCQDMEVVKEIAAELKLGVRKNGKATMEVPNARSLLGANSREINVSNNRLCTLLREHKMDLKTQKQAAPHQSMRSLHPNHVHECDPSLCLLYYLPNGGAEIKVIKQRWIGDDEAYKNKPETLEKIGELKVWRYVLVDHYSNTIILRYYQSKGETQENLFDFLMYAWSKIEGKVLHGVPDMLYWDKGSANTSSAIITALTALQVKTETHQAGNPRAKGAAEEGNNRVEKLFESRLRYEPVSNIDELNAAAEAWCHAYNSDCIPHYNAKLKRPLMKKALARNEIWQTIRSEYLRLLPDIEVCRYLLTAKPIERTVTGDLTISFVHPKVKRSVIYDLTDVPGTYPKLVVKVSPLIYGDNQAIIYNEFEGEKIETVVSPKAVADDLAGFAQDAPIFGEEYKSHAATVVDKVGQESLEKAFPDMTKEEREKVIKKNKVPFGGLNAHSHLKDVYTPDYMQKRGSVIDVPDRKHVEIKPLTVTEICKRLVNDLGRSEDFSYHQYVKAEYSEGILPDDYPQLLTAISELLNPNLKSIAN